MPEGPEIKRAADRVAQVIEGRVLQSVEFFPPQLAPYVDLVIGKKVVRVEPRGKAMLVYIGPELVLYSHNQLYGRWYTTRTGQAPRTKRQLRVALHTAAGSARLYSASDIAMFNRDSVEEHGYVKKLGPDPLNDATSEDELVTRLRDPLYERRALGGLYLDQGFIAGIGNYLRSEILYLAKIHPKLRPRDLDARRCRQLARRTLLVTRQAYATGGVTNDLNRVDQLIRKGQRRGQYRHWVFGRAGKPCYRCKSKIEKAQVAGRRLYLCPGCQPIS